MYSMYYVTNHRGEKRPEALTSTGNSPQSTAEAADYRNVNGN